MSRLYSEKRFVDNKILLAKLPLSNSVVAVPPPSPTPTPPLVITMIPPAPLLLLLSEALIDNDEKFMSRAFRRGKQDEDVTRLSGEE